MIVMGNVLERIKERRLRMIQTLTKNWYLLVICGILNAIIAAIYFVMYDAGQDAMPFQGWYSTVVLLSRLSVVAGVGAIAAGVWRSSQGISWSLILNGLALSAYGLIPLLSKGPLGFRLFALLVVMMAMSFGILAFEIAWAMRRLGHDADQRLFGWVGAASVSFAFAFLCLVNDWIQLARVPFHPPFFLWLCLFFGFSAAAILALAMRLRSLGRSQSGTGEVLPRFGSRRYAH
jgi:hypothetical protein